MPRAGRVCSTPGCGEYAPNGGRGPDCRAAASAARGTRQQQGYGRDHDKLFRAPVLRRDPVCVICKQAPSRHADHHPLSRKELIARGENPNDPKHGRGLCHPCHSSATAADPAQRGGWADR